MSVRALSWAFSQSVNPTEKIVLIALADHANDEDFECWPNHSTLEAKTSLSNSGVRKALASLVRSGVISRIDRFRDDGSQTSNRYRLNAKQPDVSPKQGDAATNHPPATIEHPPATTKHPRTIREPSGDRQVNNPPTPFELPSWVPAEPWADFCELRISRNRKTWTLGAKKRTIAELAKLRDQGHDPADVLNQSVQRGWMGVFPLKAHHQPQGGNDEPEVNPEEWERAWEAEQAQKAHRNGR